MMEKNTNRTVQVCLLQGEARRMNSFTDPEEGPTPEMYI
jgi:hypothetical protein